MAQLHVLGDGASWIWKAADRALTGCRQTLDIFHACEHIAAAGQRLYGEGTAEASAFHEHGRGLLLREGWAGICRLIGEELAREDTPNRRGTLDRLLRYFVPHVGRLDYAGRLASGDAIGSGGGGRRGQDAGPTAKGPRRPVAAQECPRDVGTDLL